MTRLHSLVHQSVLKKMEKMVRLTQVISIALIALLVLTLFYCTEEEYGDEAAGFTHPPDECPIYLQEHCQNNSIHRCLPYDALANSFIEGSNSLYKKALEYDRYAKHNHRCNGFIADCYLDSEDPVIGDSHVTQYTGVGDGACWTGHYLFSQSYRYRTNGNGEALENIRSTVETIKGAFQIAQASGNHPGLCARFWGPKSDTRIDANNPLNVGPGGGYRDGIGEWSEYFWDGCISTDQYSGLMLGLSAAYQAVRDQEIRNNIQWCVTNFVDALMTNERQLMIKLAVPEGSTGRSFHEEYDGEWYLNFNLSSINNWATHDCGIYTLCDFKMAYNMTGKAKYNSFYHDVLINQMGALEDMSQWNCIFGADCFPQYNHYYNNNIAIIALFTLISNENQNMELQNTYKTVMEENFWYRLQEDKNAWFAALYAVSVTRDEEALAIINNQLQLFPDAPRRKINVVMDPDDPRIERDENDNVLPLDIHLRSISDFQWQRSPNGFTSNPASNHPLKEYPGVDYLTVYWFSRYNDLLYEENKESQTYLKWKDTGELCNP